MARMMDDGARAAMLSRLLGGDDEEGSVATSYPAEAGRGMDEDQIQRVMPPSNNLPNADRMREQHRLQAPGPQATVTVPASLAHAGMAALMQQASGNAISKSYGSDGGGMRNRLGQPMPDPQGDARRLREEYDETQQNEEKIRNPTTNKYRNVAEALVPNAETAEKLDRDSDNDELFRQQLENDMDDSYDGPNAVPGNRLPPVDDPEQIEMIRRGRDRRGRQA